MAKLAAAVLARAGRADTTAVTDRDLLRRFVEAADQTAFAAVVRRHSVMVFGVCRRVLPSPADAEDATQAVFLVLAKKAAGTRWQPSVANWLYTTARKVAHNARLAAERRAKREGVAAVPEAVPPADALSGRELVAALDEELDRLPPRYREPLVLCYLEGLTRDQAAARLGQTVPALNKQLERGRNKLADALTARGCSLGVLLLAAVATSSAGASPSKLLESILATAGGTPSGPVAALARGVAMNGTLARMKLVLAAAVGVAAVGLGVGAVPPAAAPAAEKMDKPKADSKAEPKPPQVQSRTITGTVVGPDGKPVRAELTMVWQGAKTEPLGPTAADGSFRVTVPLRRGNYGGWLVATAPGHGADFLAHGTDYLPQTMTPTAEVTLKLPAERPVRGRLLDQQGKPVAGARVVASTFSAFDSDASMAAHLKRWADELYLRGVPPAGDRGMYYSDGYADGSNPAGRTPYTATTGPDGRFEIAGAGANQLVHLRVRAAAGAADKDVVSLNRTGFDPEPTNKVTRVHQNKEFGGKWVLYGPDPVIVLDAEKIIRGTVTDPSGRPRAGVRVAFTRPNKQELTQEYNTAVTDKDGKYEIRGARKHKGYMVEIPPDPAAGLLECQAFADDTVGYEPIVIDIKQVKGVVVTGRVTNKATGGPVVCDLYAAVMANNPFVDKYPPFLHGASSSSELKRTDKDGKFRIVVIPGPVVLSAAPRKGDGDDFKPVTPDPKHAASFYPSEGALMYDAFGGGRGFVNGNACKVLEAKPGDTEITVNLELDPALKTPVKVVDADGKPVTGCKATGIGVCEFANPTEFPDDALTVYNLDVPVPDRKLSEPDLMPGKPMEKPGRLLAVVHEKRKLVGTLTLTTADKDPVVTLAAPGSVSGRAVGKDGKPLAGLSVYAHHARREVAEAFKVLTGSDSTTTDANGEFRFDGLFPGQEFTLSFYRGQKRIGPDAPVPTLYKVTRPGEFRKLADFVLEPAKKDGE